MNHIWLIAKREMLEQRRQPWMLLVVASTFIVLGLIVVPAVWILDTIANSPELHPSFTRFFPGDVQALALLSQLADGAVSIGNYLFFAQFMGISGVLAGHSMLHDRQCHTLPFLLLAPIRRVELISGKVLGTLLIPLALYWILVGACFAFLSRLSIVSDHPGVPLSSAWLISFFIGGPAWTLASSTICALIGHHSVDVRTAQQGVWFVVLFSTLACGYGLNIQLSAGASFQMGLAVLGGIASLLLLSVGGVLTR